MAITYTLTNDDGGRFLVDAGVVKVAASLAGSAGTRTIGVRATDGNGWVLDKNINITVTAAAWTPASITTQLWYDPSDLSTMFTDTAGTVPVTTDGDLVARINDKSGNGRHWLQSTSSKRPLYKTDGTLRWLLFDGIDDGFNVSVTAGDLISTSSAVIGISPGASETSWTTGHSSLSTGTQYFGLVQSGNTGSPHGSGAGTPTYRVNGVAIASATRDTLYTALPSSSVGVMTVEALNLSTWGAFTAFDYPGFITTGKCYGYIVPIALSSGDRSSIETWMGAKAGIVL